MAVSVPAAVDRVQTVLLTGANGYLGRFLALEWLHRLAATGGRLITLMRGEDAESARRRLQQVFDSDPAMSDEFRELAAGHLEVIPGDIGEPNLGLDEAMWQRLAREVDLIVHPAALVNHVLPYAQLFGPNVVGTAAVMRLAISERLKPGDLPVYGRSGHGDGRLRRRRRHPRSQRTSADRQRVCQRLRQ